MKKPGDQQWETVQTSISLCPPVLGTVLLWVSGSEKFRRYVFWKREGKSVCGG